jgi:TPR repeat protein
MIKNKIDEFVKPHYAKKTVEYDSENAQYLAKLYYNGEVTEENLDHNAMHNLAELYYNRKGTEKNLEKAFYWYQKAVENGNICAMNHLAECYKNGEGTEKNLENAFYWYKKQLKMVMLLRC